MPDMSPARHGWAALAVALAAGCGESVAPFDGVYDFELRFAVGGGEPHVVGGDADAGVLIGAFFLREGR